MSGNDSVSFQQGKKKKASHSIDVQTVSHGERGYVEIHQRLQPMLATIQDTVGFLTDLKIFVENFNVDMPFGKEEPIGNALGLSKVAAVKRSEIKNLLQQRDEIIEDLKRFIASMPSAIAAPSATVLSAPSAAIVPSAAMPSVLMATSPASPKKAVTAKVSLEQASHNFIRDMHQELIICLNVNDFNFNGMGDMKNDKNIARFIAVIQEQLADKKLSELLNSKHFNLGCSEPLLLFDLFDAPLQRMNLINRITAPLKEQKSLNVKKEKSVKEEDVKILKEIVIQLHSTKTPCKSCLIGCCGHLAPNGMLDIFMKELKSELVVKFKNPNVFLRFMISYNDFYGDKYPFYIPMTSHFLENSGTLLLMNMRLYKEEFKALKRRIIEEYRLKLQKKLQTLQEEKKGSITQADIEKVFQ